MTKRTGQTFAILLVSLVISLTTSVVTVVAHTPQEKTTGSLEQVVSLNGPLPTGISVSAKGRIFVSFPRWGDRVDFTVAEIKDGRPVPYPSADLNRDDKPQSERLVSVQSVVVDPLDRLWLLDTGSIKENITSYGGPKLVGIDLATNQVVKKILFPVTVALPTTYLNDIRFDLRRGRGGMAFITDSSQTGVNGIIVVDLESGESFRRLNDHPSTKAEPNFLPTVEGQPLMNRTPGKTPTYMVVGSDGIAISADGERLFYCPLSSRKLYSVSVNALVNRTMSDAQVAATVVDHGDKGTAADGLESDAKSRIYVTSFEHNAVVRRQPNGLYETVVHDPRMLWPDTLSVARDGYLYFTANQIHRQSGFHNGKDLRQKPYGVFRVKIDSGPVLLQPRQ